MHTTPIAYDLTKATLSPEKLEVIEEWYHSAPANEDVATDIEDNIFYEGQRAMTEDILGLLVAPDVATFIEQNAVKEEPDNLPAGLKDAELEE